ncbi:XdhC family protein [Paenibacillus sp. UNC496MF]|uniref:XdhC family protein n=1 Tax=Paenibacillus sp. UNC496MF TaxID=1502753 RepID=UPI000B322CD2|nr:XdhC/CoxI family protein [Paenibacillus sp. UNC496MF]
MNDRCRMLRALKALGRQRCAMATVIAVEGSAYRHAGAKMLIGEDGAAHGVISAGCLEEDLPHRAGEVIAVGRPMSLTYDLRAEDDLSWGRGAGCNGRVTVYVEPCAWADGAGGGASLWARASACLERGARLVHARRLRGECLAIGAEDEASGARPHPNSEAPSRPAEAALRPERGDDPDAGGVSGCGGKREDVAGLFYAEDGETFGSAAGLGTADGWLLPALGRFLASGAAIAIVPLPAGEGALLLELYRPPERLIVFGAGPDTELLVRLAAAADFAVTVVDPREARCSAAHYPDARLVALHPETYLARHPIPADAFVLVMTHGFAQDRQIVRRLLQAPPRYAGVLGARGRTERLVAPDPVPGWLRAPVGADIGAEGPEEIAVSIVAELIAHRSGRRRRPA